MLKDINQYIKEYIDNYSLKTHPELINYVRIITDLILENQLDLEEKEYIHEVDINTSQKLAFEFLNYLNIGIKDILANNLEALNIHFKSIEQTEDDIKTSYQDYDNGSVTINIIYYNDLSDCYTIIHELLHATNIVLEDDLAKKYRRDILTETISLLGTVEAEKYYLNTRGKEEFKINKLDDYFGIYENAKKTKETLKLVDLFLNNNEITIDDLANIDEDTIAEIIANKEVQIPFYERYLLAYVLVNYIETNYNGIDILKNLITMINNNSLSEIFNYLDLDFDIIKVNKNIEFITDINEDTKKKLEQSLKGKIK